VFLAIWVNHEHWNPAVALRPYLYRAVRNAILKTVRHERVTRKAETRVDPNHPYGMGTPSPATDAALESSDIVHTVASAVRQLPERQRTAIMLRWYDNMTTAEIAVVMGISRQAVEKSLHTAEARLGTVLARKMGF
jgi:RNA polymerase sigma-70 factor (ECF subfamily)